MRQLWQRRVVMSYHATGMRAVQMNGMRKICPAAWLKHSWRYVCCAAVLAQVTSDSKGKGHASVP